MAPFDLQDASNVQGTSPSTAVAIATDCGNFPPMRPSPVRSPGLVAVLAYDGLCTFEFGVAVEVFGLARPEFDFPWYRFVVVAAERRRARAIGGIVVEADATIEVLRKARTIIVPGWRDRNERPPEPLLRAIARASKRGARCLSICSGVFVLAAAGLLDGRRATTHWRYTADLRRLYPSIEVEEDVLYVDAGNIITSAGSAAGIDACLHLVRRDYGTKVANTIARRLVMPPHRDGGQAQYVAAPVQLRPGRAMSEVVDWARGRLSQPIELSDLAGRAAMSERTFLRRFREAVGRTPKAWLQQERIYRAQELLETTTVPLDGVADQCGYRSLETFRVAFKRSLGISPGAYRIRFRGTDIGMS
jgi:AraC family transcriptional regulator, transcriptional activator FtrA